MENNMCNKTKYETLYGESDRCTKELHGVKEVAEFIVTEGIHGDVHICSKDLSLVITTVGFYLDKISDMDYRVELLEVLIPMQKEAEEKAGLGHCECDGEVQE